MQRVPNNAEESMKIYKIWAPQNCIWSRWALPVMFMNLRWDASVQHFAPDLSWLVSLQQVQGGHTNFRKDTAVILEIPGIAATLEALELAKLGFCPVPLFNGVAASPGAQELVSTHFLSSSLYNLAPELSQIRIPDDAPPVFMLDSNRKGDGIFNKHSRGAFDNRWNIFSQELPSAEFLRSRGITRIILRTLDTHTVLANDLHHVIYRFQEGGMEVLLHNGTSWPFVKPKSYKNTAYRLLAMAGFKRNSAGGFGALIPEESESSSYSYGYGRRVG
jgi:hypothetical protein